MAKSRFLNGYKPNFETLKRAALAGDLALMECQDAKTGKKVATIVAVNRTPDGQFEMAPLAKLFDGNPYEELNPPNPDGGFFSQEDGCDVELMAETTPETPAKSLGPIVWLECNCCGNGTRGRQWWNRDTGYGMCAECLTYVRSKGMPDAEIRDYYGIEGVHCGNVV